jgi:hypothetical protein
VVLPQKSYSWLTAPAILVLAGFACAQASAVRPQFEVASIKPNTSGGGLAIMRPPAGGGFTPGGPPWLDSKKYDVNAKVAESKDRDHAEKASEN